MKSVIAWSAAASFVPLAALAEGDLSGYDGATQMSFPVEVTQGASGATAGPPDHQSASADDLSKAVSSINNPLAQLTFKQIYTQFQGDLPGADDQNSMVTQFQPAFPFPIGEGTNLFIRPLITYVWKQPVFDPVNSTWSNKSGFGDVVYDVAIGKNLSNGWMVVGGLQGTIPTDTDVSGGQWRLGPEFAFGRTGEKAYGFLFPQHQWDVGGDDYRYSTTAFEIIGGIYLKNAWTVYTDSTVTYDWAADQWTVPINISVKKVTKIGNTPVQFVAGYDYYVNQNDAFGQDWAIKFQITPIVQNFIYDWIKG